MESIKDEFKVGRTFTVRNGYDGTLFGRPMIDYIEHKVVYIGKDYISIRSIYKGRPSSVDWHLNTDTFASRFKSQRYHWVEYDGIYK